MIRLHSPRVAIFAVAAAVSLGALSALGVGLAYNTSASMPAGLYLTYPQRGLARGDIVALCVPSGEHAELYRVRRYLPASERCASGLAPVLKPLAALAGDTVAIDAAGVRLNGVAVANSPVLGTDSDSRPMPHLAPGWHRRLGHGEVFVLATHSERSLDSRYYGVVPANQVLARALPILTF